MYLIGLTGNIATGKSTVARMLHQLGAQVIDADALAHRLMEPHTGVWRKVVEAFGPGVVGADERIDRARLGALVFSDAEALRRLEEIVHPAVVAETGRILRDIERQHGAEGGAGPVVVLEAIKLIESGLAERCDSLWVVTSGREKQIQRLVEKRGLSREEATLRIEAQPPQEDKSRLADVVIENNGSMDDLRARVEAEWGKIQLSASPD